MDTTIEVGLEGCPVILPIYHMGTSSSRFRQQGNTTQAPEPADKQQEAVPEPDSGDRKGKGPILDGSQDIGDKRKRASPGGDSNGLTLMEEVGEEEEPNEPRDDDAPQDGSMLEESPKRKKTKRELDALRKERNLADLLLMMDEFQPLVSTIFAGHVAVVEQIDCHAGPRFQMQ